MLERKGGKRGLVKKFVHFFVWFLQKCACVEHCVLGSGDVVGSDGDLDVGECKVRWEKMEGRVALVGKEELSVPWAPARGPHPLENTSTYLGQVIDDGVSA